MSRHHGPGPEFDSAAPQAVWIPLPEAMAFHLPPAPQHGAGRVDGSLWSRLRIGWLKRLGHRKAV